MFVRTSAKYSKSVGIGISILHGPYFWECLIIFSFYNPLSINYYNFPMGIFSTDLKYTGEKHLVSEE